MTEADAHWRWAIFFGQFKNIIVRILIIAGVIGEGIVVLNAVIRPEDLAHLIQ